MFLTNVKKIILLKIYSTGIIKSSLYGENGKFLRTDYNWIYVLMYRLVLCILIMIDGERWLI